MSTKVHVRHASFHAGEASAPLRPIVRSSERHRSCVEQHLQAINGRPPFLVHILCCWHGRAKIRFSTGCSCASKGVGQSVIRLHINASDLSNFIKIPIVF